MVDASPWDPDALAEQVAHFCRAEVIPNADAWDRDQALPRAVVELLASEGWLVATLPEAIGGAGCDGGCYVRLAEELGAACQSLRNLIAVQGMVAHAIHRWAPPAMRARWPEEIARGRAVAAFALTEPGGGSNARGLATRIHRRADRIVLNGTKSWISFADGADLLLVVAADGEGVAAVLVEPATEGVAVDPVRDLLGLRASRLGHIRFDDCVLSPDRVVATGPLVFPTLVMGALDYGRLSTAAGSVGLARACLSATSAFVRARDGAEGGLLRHQLVRGKLADMIVRTQAARLMVGHAARLRDRRDPQAPMATLAAKYFASACAAEIAADAVQLHGAAGVAGGSSVQRHFRDSKIAEIIEGPNEVLQNEIAMGG